MAERLAASVETLSRIAETLGVSVEELRGDVEPHHLWAAGECMRLWYRLRSDAGRDKVLDALRRALDEEAA